MIPTAAANQQAAAASAARQEEVVTLYLTGSSMRSIAAQLGISVETVSRDIERAVEDWKAKAARTYTELLPEKLAQTEAIRQQAWIGWKRSLGVEVTHMKEKGDGTNGPHNKRRRVRKNQTGNPQYLQRLESILRLECQILGMLAKDAGGSNADAPEVVEVVISTKDEHEEFKTLSMEQYRERVGKVG